MGKARRTRGSFTGSRLLDRILGCSPTQIQARMAKAEKKQQQQSKAAAQSGDHAAQPGTVAPAGERDLTRTR